NKTTGVVLATARVAYDPAVDGPLGAGASSARHYSLHLTDGTPGVGQLEFAVTTDVDNQVTEYNADRTAESNNAATVARDVALGPYADLAASAVMAPSLTIDDPAEVTIGWTVTNVGTGPGSTSAWRDDVIASPDDVAGNGDDIVLGRFAHSE